VTERLPGAPAGFTVTFISSEVLRTPSFAVSLRTYEPEALKLAVVLSAFVFPKLTVPGPLTTLQVVVNEAGGLGKPSSVTVPFRVTPEGSVVDWSEPAFTIGGVFAKTERLAASRVTLATG
jgi:hypothetical protein